MFDILLKRESKREIKFALYTASGWLCLISFPVDMTTIHYNYV